MVRSLVFLLFGLLAFWTRVEAQEIIVNGINLQQVHSNLQITIDIIEFRQDDEPVVHGRRHAPQPVAAIAAPTLYRPSSGAGVTNAPATSTGECQYTPNPPAEPPGS